MNHLRTNLAESPGIWDEKSKISKLANGEWEVLYAPHLYRLQQVCLKQNGILF